MSTFLELGITKDYVKGLKALGIKHPTKIQQAVIPQVLHKKTDLIGLAQTGTGKTAAYGLPVLHRINASNSNVQTLIIAPTRELVQQIKKQLFKFTKYVPQRIFVEGVYGGEKIDKQIKNLSRTTHIVVATPGRLLDLIERGIIDISEVHTLVLDEADEMLSMGFKEDLRRILKYNTSERQTWLFSATMPEIINDMVKTYMSKDAVRIHINRTHLINENISHHFIQTTIKDKVEIISKLLASRNVDRGIIFCRTKAGTRKLVQELKHNGHVVEGLEGDMQQKERDKVMRAFKNESLQVLVSTDVSARGIDVTNLAFVIHHQLPEQLEYYTHRSGRTARAGKKGESIALIISGERSKIKALELKLNIQFREMNL